MNLDERFSGFKSAERPSNGLALIFDISGFTNFFNKPDIQDYITDYINQIINCVETCIWGGDIYWIKPGQVETEATPMFIKPSLRKFLGDGMLYVWEDDDKKIASDSAIRINLLNSLWNIHAQIDTINKKIRENMPVADLPADIKFGLAQGSIYKLTENDGTIDYIGPCINLASRLVKYCPDMSIIASTRLRIYKEDIEAFKYKKVIAKVLRSFEKEIVIVDKNDYDNMVKEERERLFEEL